MKKVLFIAAHRTDRSPSQRFRFEQYFEFLEKNGFSCELSSLLSKEDDAKFYSPGNYATKLKIWRKSRNIRKKDVARADEFDIIFIQREAFMTGSIKYEKAFAKSKAKLIFDFDDSIWLVNVSSANRKLAWLKNNDKTKKIIELSDMIFAGNKYLSDYASQFNQNVKIIPTTIDTEIKYNLDNIIKNNNYDKFCIGWTGSVTTIQHFECALPFLKILKENFGDKIEIKVIGDGNYFNDELNIKGISWNKETELDDLSSIDIGIMPLPNDEWAKGKCGLKGLQYMALGIATVMSPVGVNTKIIDHAKNGFLANDTDEWVNIITELINSNSLREQISKAAIHTIEENYSVKSQQNNYLKCFNELIN